MAGELNIELCRYTNEIKLPEEVKGKKKRGKPVVPFPSFPLNKKKTWLKPVVLFLQIKVQRSICCPFKKRL